MSLQIRKVEQVSLQVCLQSILTENLSAIYKTQAADDLTQAELRPLFLQTLKKQSHTESQNHLGWKLPPRSSPVFDLSPPCRVTMALSATSSCFLNKRL